MELAAIRWYDRCTTILSGNGCQGRRDMMLKRSQDLGKRMSKILRWHILFSSSTSYVKLLERLQLSEMLFNVPVAFINQAGHEDCWTSVWKKGCIPKPILHNDEAAPIVIQSRPSSCSFLLLSVVSICLLKAIFRSEAVQSPKTEPQQHVTVVPFSLNS